MAEVQTHTDAGEMTQRFIEFVMMQAQNAAFALGQIPHPESGDRPVNLEMAKLFIDQLAMIRSKTRGNLSNEELAVLNNAISNLQMAFVEVSQSGGGARGASPLAAEEDEETAGEENAAAEAAGETAGGPAESRPGGAAQATSSQEPPLTPAPEAGESKKKFSKSYGA